MKKLLISILFSCYILTLSSQPLRGISSIDTIIIPASTVVMFSTTSQLFENRLTKGSCFEISVLEDVYSSDGKICIRKGEKSYADVVEIDSAFLKYKIFKPVPSVAKSQIPIDTFISKGIFRFSNSLDGKSVFPGSICKGFTRREEKIVINRTCPGNELPHRRLALIIGNSSYKVNPLENPLNDARDIVVSLAQFGFDTIYRENLDIYSLLDAIEAFRDSLDKKRYEVAFVYYSGHGLEIGGKAYIVPLDARINKPIYVGKECIEISELLEAMPVQFRIIVFDACRDNPFEKKSEHPKSATEQNNPVDRVSFGPSKPKTLLVYASSTGKTADDSGSIYQKNSAFTGNLKLCLQEKVIAFPDVFNCVQDKMMSTQSPESTTTFGHYYLRW